MPDRQSTEPSPVSRRKAEARARAKRVGVRIQARMEELGWTDEKGPHVRTLQERVTEAMELEKPIRWPTVQAWVRGQSVPKAPYDRYVAEVLGMTLDELAGLAEGQEPTSKAWTSFRDGPVGQSATDEEIRSLLRHVPPAGREFQPWYYEQALNALRYLTSENG